MLCLCGSKLESSACCVSIVENSAIAVFPEALMRSRYYCFALKNAKYLVDTHAPDTRENNLLEDITQWCNETSWRKLIVHSADNVKLEDALRDKSFTTPTEQLPTVCFSAFYLYRGELYEMKELSRFIIINQKWHYFDGDSLQHVNYGKVGSNKPCPCQSGAKYKRCCGKR